MLFNPFQIAGEAVRYSIDSAQRSLLFLDTLRQRGNRTLEHYNAGKPPVLVFDYETVLDGASFERPCNYVLLRITPPKNAPTDPAKRPFVVFDPRAGHGPGISGSKESSQVGVALRAGHAVYFVSFRPEPEPQQTLRDVARAEKRFLEKVAELHPGAPRPAIVGNCQAGWAIMMLAAYAPDLASMVGVAGAPLSYWAGVEGRNPMRYFGGLTGGTWLSALAADLGAGTFDGAHLVSNFESLDPANALVGKPYRLYANVDTEAERFLDFERWWSGYFLLSREEIVELTSELFVGNKLTQGGIVTDDGAPIDLRDIRAPIVVIASEGDNITPPPQALNWILDLYADVEEIRANEQTIVYTVHPDVGHLGIFVSGRVAAREHEGLVNSLDLIDTLPPGLFEMVVDEVVEQVGDGLDAPAYTLHFEARTLDDIRAYDDGRADEEPFRAVARFSEINEGLYSSMVAPWVRLFANAGVAELGRMMNPQRLRYTLFSDANPMMAGVRAGAEIARRHRAPVPEDHPMRRLEADLVGSFEQAIRQATEQRDVAIERVFKTIWTHPLIQALAGEKASHADSRKPTTTQRRALEQIRDLRLEAIAAREHEGGFADAVLRIVYAAIKAGKRVDAQAFAAAREIWNKHERFADLDRDTFIRKAREAALMVAFDEDAALAALPRLLPAEADRADALHIIARLIELHPDVAPEMDDVRARVEDVLAAEAVA
jgi:pimeloyl-ACP methyl ester carboxylesterase